MKTAFVLFLSTLFFLTQFGCGVKSKPLAPLKEPWISTGDLEKDRERKNKQKRPTSPAETRVEFTPNTTPADEKKEH